MEGRRFAVLFVLASLIAAGCRHSVSLPFETFAEPEPAYSPSTSTDNAFDSYALAAADVEAKCAKYLNRNFFTLGMKQECLRLMDGALAKLRAGAGRKCLFQFRPHKPGDLPQYQQGWRLLGRALVWQIEQAVIDEEYVVAVQRANEAISFGFDLVGGGALDASLGLVIVDEARTAIAPALGRMEPEQLAALETGVTRALLSRPLLAQAFENERENMLLAVQGVQDALRDNKWDHLEKLLDKDARPAIEYLKRLKEDDQQRVDYFRDFAEEADREVDWLIEQSKLPKYKRAEKGPETDDEHRPWRRFSKHLFRTGRPLLDQELRTLARTRLLVLHAVAVREFKATKKPLASIDTFPIMIKTDPYTGRNFILRAVGSDFKVYSVGEDGRDNGGESDESYTAPDLLLESRR